MCASAQTIGVVHTMINAIGAHIGVSDDIPQSLTPLLTVHAQPLLTRKRAMMSDGMSGWYSSMGSGNWLFGIVIGVAVVLVIAAAVKYLGKSK